MVEDSRPYDMGVLVYPPQTCCGGKNIGKANFEHSLSPLDQCEKMGVSESRLVRVTSRTKVLRVSYTL